MIVVTGGAGFIGANLVRALHGRGAELLVVERPEARARFRRMGLDGLADWMTAAEFLDRAASGRLPNGLEAVLHHGACTDTLRAEARELMEANFGYARRLLSACQRRRIPLIYASSAAVYGAATVCRESAECQRPLNVYGFAKLQFDNEVRRILAECTAPVIGLRYFNVYGPMEAHKGEMASMAYRLFRQYIERGYVELYEGSDGYGPGEQRRDFVSVEDVVDVNLFFLERLGPSGIYNVGTGTAHSFNTLAAAVVNTCRRREGARAAAVQALRACGVLRYIRMPNALAGRYQSFTCAELTALRAAGFEAPFTPLEAGVARYVGRLLEAEASAPAAAGRDGTG